MGIWIYYENLENTSYENRLHVFAPQIIPPFCSETFKLRATTVPWKGVPIPDHLLYKSFRKELTLCLDVQGILRLLSMIWVLIIQQRHQGSLKKRCFGATNNILLWNKISIFNKRAKKTCLKNQKQFSYWFPLFPSNIAFHFSYCWFLEKFLKTVKLYHSFCSSYISSRSFNIDFIIYYVYREIIAIFLTYSSYCVMEKRENRRGGHDIKVLLDYIIYRCVCP